MNKLNSDMPIADYTKKREKSRRRRRTKKSNNLLLFIAMIGFTLVVFITILLSMSYNSTNEGNCNPNEKFNRDNPNNWAIQLSKEHLSIIRTTFGFISPPLVARALAMVNTVMYNTMAVYNSQINFVYEECVNLNKLRSDNCQKPNDLKYSMLVSVDRMIRLLYKPRTSELDVYKTRIQSFYDKFDSSFNVSNAKEIGKKVFRCVRKRFIHDGSNQLGDEPGTKNNEIYSDYTNYQPTNPPQDYPGITNCSKLNSFNHWQQLKVPKKDEGYKIREFLTPHMDRVKPFALINAYEVFPPPPPLLGTNHNSNMQQMQEIAEVLKHSAEITDKRKIIAEYWADGPKTTQPPGHWNYFAIEMSIKKELSLFETIEVLFLQSNAVFDAAIASWAAKRYYDFVRPITLLQCIYGGQLVKAWKGPYQGVGIINGAEWKPYQFSFFLTPPFAEYPSGHSTFSNASATVLKLYFGSDEMGLSHTVRKGESLFEYKIKPGETGYIANITDVPNTGPETTGYVPAKDITLTWNTFTEAASQSGISRLYGGIHFQAANIEGLKMGDKIGKIVYEKFKKLINKD